MFLFSHIKNKEVWSTILNNYTISYMAGTIPREY
jgi:hypothetical protein